jgi:hypothetical protein
MMLSDDVKNDSFNDSYLINLFRRAARCPLLSRHCNEIACGKKNLFPIVVNKRLGGVYALIADRIAQ